MPKYIRKREDTGRWQLRLYNGDTKLSFTSPDLDEVIEKRNDELGYDPDEIERQPKILIFDIETAPILAYVWGLYRQNVGINQIKEDWYMLCFAYKWLGDSKVKTVALCDFPGYKSGNDCEELLVGELYKLLDEADVVVAHNAKRFDVARANAKFMEFGLSRPLPFKIYDTLKTARKLAVTSRKLDYLSKYVGGGGKVKHNGMELWIGCMEGDPIAWQKMKKYVNGDIIELERVFIALRGWSNGDLNLSNFYSGKDARCISCLSDNIEYTGTTTTGIHVYPLYKCNNCGENMRGRTNVTPKDKEILVAAK